MFSSTCGKEENWREGEIYALKIKLWNQKSENEWENPWARRVSAHISDYIWWCQWEDAMNYYFKVLSDTKGSAWKKFQRGPPFFSSPIPTKQWIWNEILSCSCLGSAAWYACSLLTKLACSYQRQDFDMKREKNSISEHWKWNFPWEFSDFPDSRRERLPIFYPEENYPNIAWKKSLPFYVCCFYFSCQSNRKHNCFFVNGSVQRKREKSLKLSTVKITLFFTFSLFCFFLVWRTRDWREKTSGVENRYRTALLPCWHLMS